MIAGKNKNIIRIVSVDKLDVLINGVCGAAIPVGGFLALIRREDLYSAERAVKVPRQTVADVIVEQERLVLREHTYRVDPGIDTV